LPQASELLAELDMDEVNFELKHKYVKPQREGNGRGKLVVAGWNETDVVNVVRQLQAAGYANLAVYPRGIVDWISHGGVTEVQGARKRTPIPTVVTTGTDTVAAEDRMDDDGHSFDDDGYFYKSEENDWRRSDTRLLGNRKVHRAAGFDQVDEREIDCE
jgi:hypothetical protein